MENKLYKYILLLEILLVTAIPGTPWLAYNFRNTTLEEAGRRLASHYETLSLPFGWLYGLDNLPNMIFHQYQQGSVIDVFVSPVVWLLTSCLWGGVLYWIIRLLRKKTDTAPSQGSFWKKVFLSNLLISLVAFTFIFIIRSSEINTLSLSGDDFYTATYLFCLAAIIGAFLLGACWLLIEKVWQRNRVISIALSGVVVTGMLAVIFIAYDLVHYKPYIRSDEVSPEVAQAAADLVESINEDVAGPAVVADAAAADAVTADAPLEWTGPTPPADTIRAALQFMCHSQLELAQNNGEPDDLILSWGMGLRALFVQQEPPTKAEAVRLFSTTALAPVVDIYSYTGRDGKRLKECFHQFSPYLPQILPVAVYRRSQLARYVDNLIAVRELLEEIPQYRAHLKTLYDKMNHPPVTWEPQAETYIDDIAWAVNLRNIDAAIAKGDQQGNRVAVYLVSFWARRYAEGNAEEAYYILRHVANLYGGAG